jgi:hypothetical protein
MQSHLLHTNSEHCQIQIKMDINDLYSKRKKRAERGNQPEVYQYTNLPVEFRRQVVYIWSAAIGSYREEQQYIVSEPLVGRLWHSIHNSVAKELGLFNLGSEHRHPFEQCKAFLLDPNTPIEHLLDLIEFTFRFIDTYIPELLQNPQYSDQLDPSQIPNEAISELNRRFREHEIGYQYNNGQIVRVDSSFIHAEVVVPALSLLSSQQFKGAEQEFRNAHEHYRKEEYEDAILDAQRAFESTMKIICDKCEWSYEKGNASELIDVVLENELIPKYLKNHLSGLKSVLIGVATIRNKTSAHGKGTEIIDVPEHLVAYVLHLVASNIVFLVEAYKAKQGNLP